jgi:hypothetical protein
VITFFARTEYWFDGGHAISSAQGGGISLA